MKILVIMLLLTYTSCVKSKANSSYSDRSVFTIGTTSTADKLIKEIKNVNETLLRIEKCTCKTVEKKEYENGKDY